MPDVQILGVNRKGTMMRLRSLLLLAVTLAGCTTTTDVRSDDPWDQSWHLSEIRVDDGALGLTEAQEAAVPVAIELYSADEFRGEDDCMSVYGEFSEADGRMVFFNVERYTWDADENQTSSLEYCPEGYPRGPIEAGVDIVEMTRDVMELRWKEAATTIAYRAGISG